MKNPYILDLYSHYLISSVKLTTATGHGDIVNIDSKALQRSFGTEDDKSMIYMVSAWANVNNMMLGQVKVDDKSNEITATPKLLKLLD